MVARTTRAGRPINVAGPSRCRRCPGWAHRAGDQPASGVTKAGAWTGLHIRCLEALRIVGSVREHVLKEAPQPLSDRALGQITTLRALWGNVVHLQGAP